jgi:hypothetical protein
MVNQPKKRKKGVELRPGSKDGTCPKLDSILGKKKSSNSTLLFTTRFFLRQKNFN